MKRKKKIDFFTEDEGTKLISAARALCPRWAGFTMTGLLAGLRWGEIAGLYKTDIDFKRGRIHVQRSWSPARAGPGGVARGRARGRSGRGSCGRLPGPAEMELLDRIETRVEDTSP